MARVVLAMSGGVDSSVAAALLQRAGHDVIGLFMRHGHVAETACAVESAGGEQDAGSGAVLPVLPARPKRKQGCCSASDAQDARRVADRLDIPFYAVNFEDQFGRIMDYFVEEYSAGRTPNPCVMCNNWLKFGKLVDYADGVGADFVATGHYARLAPDGQGGVPALLRGRDLGKDQSYVLFGLDRGILSRVMFPVGDWRKEDLRGCARDLGLRVADKPDSQEICFVADGDYASFVRRRREAQASLGTVCHDDASGEIVTVDGRLVGRHDGLEHFTIGQRKGLGIALGSPQYVVRLEPAERRVVIGPREALACREATASRANWLIDEPAGSLRCQVKIRYQSKPAPATVEARPGGRIQATFDEPQYGVAPGQALVCYDGDRVLGGGWLE